ncbi:unnamed protein product [Cyclocybe aegerita]|uniref:Hydrophobin n=1 Tax=Cyclocybe aegerita TaxID=1973307 RepID=A0A8S0XS00_CYCAE|nr:unnamed protein product [Cyclocybe aegerita]
MQDKKGPRSTCSPILPTETTSTRVSLMFSPLFVVSSLVFLAAASPAPALKFDSSLAQRTSLERRQSPIPVSQCNTGPILCCQQVFPANEPPMPTVLQLFGIYSVSPPDTPVGLTCPISAIGIGGNSCSALPVCCQINNWNGLIAIGCVPVNLNP